MFHQSLDVAAAEPADCPIRHDVALLAANLDTRFLRAGETLAEAIALVERTIGGLDTIVAAMDERSAGAAAADLASVARRISALPATLADRTVRMAAINGIAATLRQHVVDINSSLRVLGIYGINIKIAASGEEHFVGFVDGMNARLASGEALLASVIAKLKELEGGLAGVQQVDRLLGAECAKVVPGVPDRLAADAAALDDHLRGVADLATRVAAIARSIQAKVAVLLGALQVGDSTRQRLEHVVAALRLAEAHGCGPGAAAHVDRLVVAQLDAAAQDFARETAALVGSLEALVPDAHALCGLTAQQAGAEGRGFLLALDESVTGMDRIIVHFQSAHGEAEGMTALIAATVADLTQRVAGLSAIRLDVQDIATNTRLLCRRSADVGRAVAVVASEVDSYAKKLGTTMDAVTATIAQLDGDGVMMASDTAERDIGAVLAGAIDVIRTACQRTDQVAVRGEHDAARLVQLVETTTAALTQELALSGSMRLAAAALTARSSHIEVVPPAEEATLRATLDAIATLYTMAQERAVHAGFVLPGMDVAIADDPVPDDDDDGLF